MTGRPDILLKHKPEKENLLLILHDIQNASPEHFISEEDIIEIAKYVNITQSSVYGVVTYYSMFSLKPRGRHIIRVCCSPVCEMDDSESIAGHLRKILGIESGETTPDKLFTLETTECLGQCADSPCMIVNERYFGNLDIPGVTKIINQYKSGENDF